MSENKRREVTHRQLDETLVEYGRDSLLLRVTSVTEVEGEAGRFTASAVDESGNGLADLSGKAKLLFLHYPETAPPPSVGQFVRLYRDHEGPHLVPML